MGETFLNHGSPKEPNKINNITNKGKGCLLHDSATHAHSRYQEEGVCQPC